MILVIDFGSQTTHLISRRIADLGAPVKIVDPDEVLDEIKVQAPAGIIFSGGPASVYDKGAPTINPTIFSLGIPILGICYGWQLMAKLLQGTVAPSHKEYGPETITLKTEDRRQKTDRGKPDGTENRNPSSVHAVPSAIRPQFSVLSPLFYGIPDTSFTVYVSHGDSVISLPKDFMIIATTRSVEYTSVENKKKKFYGIQFHPEMHDTKFGKVILKNFVTRICNLPLKTKRLTIEPMLAEIKEKVGDALVLGAFSGGTDSAVAGTLVAQAIGKQFIPLYVDSGLMRDDTLHRIQTVFPKVLGVPITVIEAKQEFLERLKGVIDPEEKRKTIGKLYIELFERELKHYPNATFLLQGTTYADFIHSQGSKRSAHIKSHHNVGGLPKEMKLKLIEPLRYFYTDQVRKIGLKLGLPKAVVYQQPFPGPGHAVRVMGEVTRERLDKQKMADTILLEEMQRGGWYEKVFQCWTIMTGINSTAVKGDGRFYGEVVAIRAYTTKDRMSVDWAKIPYSILGRISSRIVNEVPGISRVVYDITTKPPATMEWE